MIAFKHTNINSSTARQFTIEVISYDVMKYIFRIYIF